MSHLDNIIYIKKDEAAIPREGHCFVDRWWTVHPEKGLAFYYPPKTSARYRYASPQCNNIKEIAESIQEKWSLCQQYLWGIQNESI